jgi:hypothetical protein
MRHMRLADPIGVHSPCAAGRFKVQCVAAQVAFRKQILKPGDHSIGLRVETRRFQAMGQRVQPHQCARDVSSAGRGKISFKGFIPPYALVAEAAAV